MKRLITRKLTIPTLIVLLVALLAFFACHGGVTSFTPGGSSKDVVVATKIVAAEGSLDKTRADYQCDGIDDQVEIQAAINALPNDGGKVLLLEGSYRTTAPVNARANLELCGQGMTNTTIEQYYRATESKLGIIFIPRGVNNVYIHDLGLDGRIDYVPEAESWWYHSGIGTGHAHIAGVAGNTNITIERLFIKKCQRGVSIYTGKNWKIADCIFEGNHGETIDIDHGNSAASNITMADISRYNWVFRNVVRGSETATALVVDDGDTTNLTNIIESNLFEAGEIWIMGEGTRFLNNTYSGSHYIHLTGSRHFISGNSLHLHTGRMCVESANTDVVNNEIAAHEYPLKVNADNVIVRGNRIYGGRFTIGGDSVIAENNILDGHDSTAMVTVGLSEGSTLRFNKLLGQKAITTLTQAASTGDTCIRLDDMTGAVPSKYIRIAKDDETWFETYIEEVMEKEKWVLLEDAIDGNAAAGNTVEIGRDCNGIYLYGTAVDTRISDNDLSKVSGIKIIDKGVQ